MKEEARRRVASARTHKKLKSREMECSPGGLEDTATISQKERKPVGNQYPAHSLFLASHVSPISPAGWTQLGARGWRRLVDEARAGWLPELRAWWRGVRSGPEIRTEMMQHREVRERTPFHLNSLSLLLNAYLCHLSKDIINDIISFCMHKNCHAFGIYWSVYWLPLPPGVSLFLRNELILNSTAYSKIFIL